MKPIVWFATHRHNIITKSYTTGCFRPTMTRLLSATENAFSVECSKDCPWASCVCLIISCRYVGGRGRAHISAVIQCTTNQLVLHGFYWSTVTDFPCSDCMPRLAWLAIIFLCISCNNSISSAIFMHHEALCTRHAQVCEYTHATKRAFNRSG